MEPFIITLIICILILIYSIDSKLKRLLKPKKAKVKFIDLKEYSNDEDSIFYCDIVIILHYLAEGKVVVQKEGSKKIKIIHISDLELIED